MRKMTKIVTDVTIFVTQAGSKRKDTYKYQKSCQVIKIMLKG